ncbi:acetoin dehydrogenase [Neisseria meningitidis]|nr:acetoin dehydrogenase [Neisseria meningitidis]RPB47465.1 acetoin dehydrogenase [Neisseria meningitidis]RPC02613.1 acetoin dehydrogenase [Neisseria meningitidis]
MAVSGGNGFVSRFSACLVLGEDAVAGLNMGNGFVAVCRFDQGAAVEGAGVGFLKNSVLNILFQMKEMPSEN